MSSKSYNFDPKHVQRWKSGQKKTRLNKTCHFVVCPFFLCPWCCLSRIAKIRKRTFMPVRGESSF